MNELALFAGAGGGILGGKLLGWKTVCAVEWDAYARDVLVARQNDGSFEAFPIWDDVQSFDGRPWRGSVDVVSGGFPCQDISAAGKGAGIDGARSGMWFHMARIIGEVGPRYVLVENSPMLTSRGLGRVLGDLAALGYDARWGVLGAVDAGAPHKRDRIWIVGTLADAVFAREWRKPWESEAEGDALADAQMPNDKAGDNSRRREPWELGGSSSRTNVAHTGHMRGRDWSESTEAQPATASGCSSICDTHRTGWQGPHDNEKSPGWIQQESSEPSEAVADANSIRGRRGISERENAVHADSRSEAIGARTDGGWWATEPDLGRVAHGVAARMDRLRCIGNGQVPAVVRLAWRVLSEGARLQGMYPAARCSASDSAAMTAKPSI